MCHKRQYSKRDAQTMVNQRTRGRSRYRHNRPDFLRAYHCPNCNGWHLTHQEKR